MTRNYINKAKTNTQTNTEKTTREQTSVQAIRNPFVEAAQTSDMGYGVFMVERNILRKKKAET